MIESYEFLPSDRPYIIAEVGGNHGGNVSAAEEYVKAAAETGADAVKFQLYQAENLIKKSEPPLPLAGDDYDSQFGRFKELELTRNEWQTVIELCDSEGIDFAASVFDTELLEFAIDHIPFVKIASGDMTHLPLLDRAAETGKPLVVSTGFSSFEEIVRIIDYLAEAKLLLLHCIGSYPTAEKDANLRTIDQLQRSFDVPIGYSDHTIGPLAVEAAAAKGARVIEKHFTLDKSKEIGDHRLSATPEEMREIVEKTDRIFTMEGSERREEVFDCETEIQRNMRRSLALNTPLDAGVCIKRQHLTALRPADGISPLRIEEVIGSKMTIDAETNHILRKSDLDGFEKT